MPILYNICLAFFNIYTTLPQIMHTFDIALINIYFLEQIKSTYIFTMKLIH